MLIEGLWGVSFLGYPKKCLHHVWELFMRCGVHGVCVGEP